MRFPIFLLYKLILVLRDRFITIYHEKSFPHNFLQKTTRTKTKKKHQRKRNQNPAKSLTPIPARALGLMYLFRIRPSRRSMKFLWKDCNQAPWLGFTGFPMTLVSLGRLGGGNSNMFIKISHRQLGKMNPFWRFFQIDWFNHQLVVDGAVIGWFTIFSIKGLRFVVVTHY